MSHFKGIGWNDGNLLCCLKIFLWQITFCKKIFVFFLTKYLLTDLINLSCYSYRFNDISNCTNSTLTLSYLIPTREVITCLGHLSSLLLLLYKKVINCGLYNKCTRVPDTTNHKSFLAHFILFGEKMRYYNSVRPSVQSYLCQYFLMNIFFLIFFLSNWVQSKFYFFN